MIYDNAIPYIPDAAKISDDELTRYIQGLQKAVASNPITLSGNSPNNAAAQLNILQQEKASRDAKAQTEQNQKSIMGLFDQNQGTPFNAEQSAQNQRQAIGDIYNNQQQGLSQSLDERYNPMRKQAIEEAGVLGNLRSPAFQSSTLANLDAQKSRDFSSGLSQLGAERGRALSGLEGDLQNRALQGYGQQTQRQLGLGGLLQGGQQFNQNFGLNQNQFQYGQTRDTVGDLWNQYGLDQSMKLGQMQADAAKPTALQQFGQIAGGVGSLAGGIGGLASGLGQGSLLSQYKKNITPKVA